MNSFEKENRHTSKYRDANGQMNSMQISIPRVGISWASLDVCIVGLPQSGLMQVSNGTTTSNG